MGPASLGERVKVAVDGRGLDAVSVDVGNPHAVAAVDSLDEAGDLRRAPEFSATDFPNGVNVEFVVRQGPADIAMRVFERGVGETQSCGTGACAAAYAVARQHGAASTATYRVHVRGGVLSATIDPDEHVHLKGPAVLVAEGVWTGGATGRRPAPTTLPTARRR
jgi:diaminopimelate epimerase